jgi:hypothetical protein
LRRSKRGAVVLQARGALFVLSSFGTNAFFLDRLRNLETETRDWILVDEIRISNPSADEQLRSEVHQLLEESKARLAEVRSLRSEITLVAGWVFALGSALTIFGFILEKWRE